MPKSTLDEQIAELEKQCSDLKREKEHRKDLRDYHNHTIEAQRLKRKMIAYKSKRGDQPGDQVRKIIDGELIILYVD